MAAMPESSAAAPDTGEVPAEVAAAVTAYAGGEHSLGEVLMVLQHSRLLVPMVEVAPGTFPPHRHHDHDQGHGDLGHDDDHGQERGHEHGHQHAGPQMAAVSLQRPDGRRGLLAFTGVEPLSRWNADARPLPMTTREAAETAVSDGASALVVDAAGPVQVVVQGEDLRALAEGWTLARAGSEHVWVPPPA
jgi:SseB protein N-terminal domain